ncbi:ERF family protein [bacterium]|nr:ERF family protein [bacterium]
MEKSESIKSLAAALCKAQGEMGGAAKGKANPFFKSKYADLSAVIQAIKEPFASNGLSYVQFPIEDNSRIGIETILMHESGEWLSQKFTVQLTKQDAQGAGSAITYCRRYGLQAVAGIPSEDDDGNAASKQSKKPQTLQLTDTDKQWIAAARLDASALDQITDPAYKALIMEQLK